MGAQWRHHHGQCASAENIPGDRPPSAASSLPAPSLGARTVLALQPAVPSSAGGWDPALPLGAPCLPPAGALLVERILDGFAVTRVSEADN